MRKTLKQILSLLLVLSMVASFTVTGWAVESADDNSDASRGVELEMEDLDPATLHVPKLGEVEETDEQTAEPLAFSPGDIVRVSIFLDKPAALDAGYSMKGVGTDSAAVSYRETLRRQQNSVAAAIEKTTGRQLDVKWNMTLAVNAISANVRYMDIVKIGMVDGVKKVVLENQYEAPDDDVAEPNTANTSENMVGATQAWADGYTGAGSRIAIIDTGIDTTHQSFDKDAFRYSLNLTGGMVNLMTSIPSGLNGQGISFGDKIPFGYNYVDKNTTITHTEDTQGNHGSHVAGIAAANRYIKSGSTYQKAAETVGAVGMAPDAQLLIMKVFGAAGGAYDSDYMVAIEDAIAMDCDVVNLSLGSAVQGFTYSEEYQDIMNNLVNKAHNEGMVVSISAGNSYDFAFLTESGNLYKDDVYYHTGGTPGTYVNSLCVAAAQNTITKGTPLTFNGSQTVYYAESTDDGEGNTYSNPLMSTIKGSYTYVYIDAVGNPEDYSTVNTAESLSGKIVIVNRGELSFSEKGNNAANYNPKGMVIANNADGVIHMNLADYTGTFPMVSITLKDANQIKAGGTQKTAGGITYYTGTVTVTDVESSVVIDRSEATITDFSSWGVPGSLIMKPEITAPGGDIYSVNGANKTTSGGTAGGSDQYVSMSGTSMAAPHITGLTAVLAQYLRENPVSGRNAQLAASYSTRAILQSLLMSTATPMKPESEYLPVLQQGAGLADVSRAIHSPSVVMMTDEGNTLTARTGAIADGKVKAELGDDPARAGEYTFGFTVYNLTDETLTYTLNTDLFTQKISGEYLSRGTSMLPAGGVTYGWSGAAAPLEEHDVDMDGDTDNDDVQMILDYLAGKCDISDLDLEAADLDGDGALSSYDAYLLIDWEPESGSTEYTVAPNDSAAVTVTISLTAEQRAFLANYATGAYLEGFTTLTCSDGSQHSIPILGFYGSWTDPSMFDNMSYVDGLYGAGRTPYSGTADTNYLMVNYNGANVKFSGNPYMVEETFPADRLAVSTHTNLIRISYNLIRSAGTTGFAVTKLNDAGEVSSVLNAAVASNLVSGQYYSQSAGWQNTGTKLYSINKTVSSYGLGAGEHFRVGFYAIPEYNGMLTNDSYSEEYSGALDSVGFQTLLTDNVLGRGAFVGYDFVVDNAAPEIGGAVLNGNTLSVTASDNENLAYLAIMSLDGTVKYAEVAPGAGTYTIDLDAAEAIANAKGYVAVFVGDYAGNESAVAVRVNDNAYEEKTVYVLSSSLTAGNDYLIVNSDAVGSGIALGHSGTAIATNAVTVHAGIAQTDGKAYIDSKDVADTSVWTASSGIKLQNGNYYLRRNSNSGTTLQASTSNNYNTWTWSGDSNRLAMTIGGSSYYLRYYNNTFGLNTAVNSVYVYQKTTILTEIDPYSVSDVVVTPASLELYKGNTADLTAKVMPLTATDRTVAWSSSNTSVATVDENGQVAAINAGTAVITATANGDSSKSASCTVNVVSVTKALNGIVWDEAGDVYFSGFNTNNLPVWTKLNDSAVGKQLLNAFMSDARTLYASTCDPSDTSIIYSVNRTTYALTEYGTNYVPAFGMARASSRYTGYFVYGFAKYLIFGNLEPETEEDLGTFSGLPYGLLDLSETDVGGAYVCGVCAKSVDTMSSAYYFLDETGKIWQTTMSIGNSVSFGTPTLVVDTGIGTSFLYQSLYYDGTNIYWSHQADNESEMIIVNTKNNAVYHAGNFGEGVWPVAGLYVNGSAAPASAEDEEPMTLTDLTIQATRDELMTDEIRARMAAEAEKFAPTEAPAYGGLNAISGPVSAGRPVSDQPDALLDPETDETGSAAVEVSERTASHNGLITVTYDPELLTYAGVENMPAYCAVNADEELGAISIAYATKTDIAAKTPIVLLQFNVSCEDSEITSATLERNDELALEEFTVNTVSGIGHDWGQPVWNWAADNNSATATFTCSVCGDEQTVEAAVTVETTAPTHTEAGETVYTFAAAFEGETYTDVQRVTLPAIGHTYGTPVWSWNEDHSAATATFTCSCGDEQTVEAAVTVETTAPTTEPGEKVYTATVTFQGETYTDIYTEVLPVALQIISQPENFTGPVGAMASFTVTAAGEGLTYQWQYKSLKDGKWYNTKVEGYDTATMRIEATAARSGMQFRCMVADAGGATVTSDPATLTVSVQALAITSQPQDYVGSIGDIADFTVTATGEGLTYQWQYKSLKDGKWYNTKVDGYNMPTFRIGITEARDGMEFRCKVADASGAALVSDSATLHAGVAFIITSQPEDYVGPIGDTASFSVAAEGVRLTYQWQYKSLKDGKWYNAKADGYNTPTMRIDVTEARNGMEFRCRVVDASGATLISDPATLHVDALLVITAQPEDYTGPIGDTASFTVAAEGVGLTYQWQYKSLKDGKWYNTKTDGYDTATMRIEVIAARNGMQFRCRVTDVNGKTATSDAATLRVAP
ncbi:MAG: S8 family serine peptidase [Oscillospiraceae bacterium]|nr:S8 family serine peptidase [Oscillospiraceae bacterium]